MLHVKFPSHSSPLLPVQAVNAPKAKLIPEPRLVCPGGSVSFGTVPTNESGCRVTEWRHGLLSFSSLLFSQQFAMQVEGSIHWYRRDFVQVAIKLRLEQLQLVSLLLRDFTLDVSVDQFATSGFVLLAPLI